MSHHFDEAAVAGVLGHMNDDHADDNALIARAFGAEGAVSATMSAFDGDGGEWIAVDAEGVQSRVRVPWPGGPISQRREVRREIVSLYDEACRVLGVEPRPHE